MRTIDWIQSEHQRIKSSIQDDVFTSRTTIGIFEVLEAHFLLAEFFAKIGEGIGGVGPKDVRLLESALSRQFSEFGGKPKWSNRIDVCATLMFGLIKNHPFYDANKRTAFLTCILHLQKIGRTPKIQGQEIEDFTVAIADNRLNKYDPSLAEGETNPDKNVRAIAEFLRRSTRDIDLRPKRITYRVLQPVLRSHGLDLLNPKGNRIDLCRVRNLETNQDINPPQRIAHIGFHGWTKEASDRDIKIIRSAARLDPVHGYDSQSFFYGAETPMELISKYQEPLQRLAYR